MVRVTVFDGLTGETTIIEGDAATVIVARGGEGELFTTHEEAECLETINSAAEAVATRSSLH